MLSTNQSICLRVSVSANQITQNCFGQEKTCNFTRKYRVVNNGPGRQIFSIIGLKQI